MKHIAPGAIGGSSLRAMAAVIAAPICARVRPASASSVFLSTSGRNDAAAGGFKQTGPRIFGFQKTGSSMPAVHERSTMQTKPLLPRAAMVYPCAPSTMISAACEIAAGAADRAIATSAAGCIMYWSAGAMAGYGVLISCAGRVSNKALAIHTILMGVLRNFVQLFVAKSDHRVHALGPAGREPAGEQGHQQQHGTGRAEAEPIGRRCRTAARRCCGAAT